MAIKLYNTLTRQEESLKPVHPGKVGLYCCGPTVYGFAHIGNLRAFTFADVLRRVLELNKLTVTQVMNITDVGHLTDDADAGEDKMIVAMRREGKTAWEIAEFYIEAFRKDLERLNIEPAAQYPRATAHISEQIEMIQALEKNGMTYATSDGVYFDTSKLESYGRLSGQVAEEKKAGARVDIGEKKHPTDFALWKFSPANEKRQMEWVSPWGMGFPGWHIECSAMSMKYLGVPFDIHTGGVDHIAVHHENELAQTEGALGVLQANIWMHNEFLNVDGGKMSKSLGNLYTLQDIIDRGFDPLAFRYLCLNAHYRSKINFTSEAMASAQNALYRLYEIVRSWDVPGRVGCADHEKKFLKAVNNDLNTPQALAALWEMVEDATLPTAAKAKSLAYFDRVLGLRTEDYVHKPLEIPETVQQLLAQREEARAAKDWRRSDELRAHIEELGFLIDDTPKGATVHLKR